MDKRWRCSEKGRKRMRMLMGLRPENGFHQHRQLQERRTRHSQLSHAIL
jgi:hypothetical protein